MIEALDEPCGPDCKLCAVFGGNTGIRFNTTSELDRLKAENASLHAENESLKEYTKRLQDALDEKYDQHVEDRFT